jgi:hypothetical protein
MAYALPINIFFIAQDFKNIILIPYPVYDVLFILLAKNYMNLAVLYTIKRVPGSSTLKTLEINTHYTLRLACRYPMPQRD